MIDAERTIADLERDYAKGDRAFLPLAEYRDSITHAADNTERLVLVSAVDPQVTRMTAVVAATTEILCVRHGLAVPLWAQRAALTEPFFLWPATSAAARHAILLDTHPAFAQRNVFVPRSVMERA